MRTAVSLVTALLGIFSALAPPARAQAALAQAEWPTGQITIVVPVAPGGVSDVMARAIGQWLQERLRQTVVIENRTGATHTIGAIHVSRSPPDGTRYLVVEGIGLMVNPSGKLPYDVVKDFTAVSGLVRVIHALVATPTFEARNVVEFIAQARARPGELNYGSFGVGSSGHMNMEMLGIAAGIKLVPVHYRGAAGAMNDVIAGHLPLMFVNLATGMQNAEVGKVKLLGVGSIERHPKLPEAPTIAESGLPGFRAQSWFGLFGPPGLPAALSERMNAQVQAAFSDPAFRGRYIEPTLYEPMVGTPEAFAGLVRAEVVAWEGVVNKLQSVK